MQFIENKEEKNFSKKYLTRKKIGYKFSDAYTTFCIFNHDIIQNMALLLIPFFGSTREKHLSNEGPFPGRE